MFNSLIIDREKGKKLPEQTFKKVAGEVLDISISYPNIFQKAQKLREEMHFN